MAGLRRENVHVSVLVTDRCTRKCPHCCFASILDKAPKEPSVDDLAVVGTTLGYVHRLHVTGGEPTEHHDFPAIARRCREIFSADTITVGTRKFVEDLRHFDEVYFSSYGDNAEDAKRLLGSGIPCQIGIVKHYPPEVIDPLGTGCHRGRANHFAVYDGRVYPCCVAPGVPESPSIPLTVDWLEQIAFLKPPCASCRFSGRD